MADQETYSGIIQGGQSPLQADVDYLTPTSDGSSLTGVIKSWADLGIYIGYSAPTLVIHEEWEVDQTGYWAWIDKSNEVVTGRVVVSSGGFLLGGAASTAQGYSVESDGGFVVGGTAGIEFIGNGQAVVTSDGGFVMGGAAAHNSGYIITADGGFVIGGAASISATPADVTAPTFQSATIATNGTTLTINFDENVYVGSGGSGGFDVDASVGGDNITCTYSSGSGSTALVYTLGTTVNSGETCNLDYTQPGNGIEDEAGNDLATFSNESITNNSTQTSVAWTEGFEAMSATPNLSQTGEAGDTGWTVRESTNLGSDNVSVAQAAGGGAARTGTKWIGMLGDNYKGAGYAEVEILIADGGMGAGTLKLWWKAHGNNSTGTIAIRKNGVTVGTAKTSQTPPGTYAQLTFTGLPSFTTGDDLGIYIQNTGGGDYFGVDIDDVEWYET